VRKAHGARFDVINAGDGSVTIVRRGGAGPWGRPVFPFTRTTPAAVAAWVVGMYHAHREFNIRLTAEVLNVWIMKNLDITQMDRYPALCAVAADTLKQCRRKP
jgi:hypothetical protein